MAHACNPVLGGGEGHPLLLREFEASLGYTKPSKIKRKRLRTQLIPDAGLGTGSDCSSPVLVLSSAVSSPQDVQPCSQQESAPSEHVLQCGGKSREGGGRQTKHMMSDVCAMLHTKTHDVRCLCHTMYHNTCQTLVSYYIHDT